MTVDPTQGTSLNDKEYDKFINCGTRKSAVRVTDTTVATNVLAVTGETVTLAAGAIGTTGVTYVDKAPVYNSTYTHVGEVGDTTFAWVTGTVLPQASEVKYNLNQTDTVQLAALTNGQWAMDYDTGRIRYCKASTGTSDTCNYGTRQLNVDITGVEDLEIGAVEIKDSDSDVRVEVHAPNGVAYGTGMTTMPARYMSTIPTITDTFSTPLLVASKGQLLANIYDGTSQLVLGTGTVKTVPCAINDGSTTATVTSGTIKALNTAITDGTTTGIIKAGNSFATTDVALGVADANVLAAITTPTTLTGGNTVSNTSGTAVALGTTLATKTIFIRAKSGNTNNVYVGSSAVHKTTSQQIILAANDSVTLNVSNRLTVYFDVDTNGEGVDYMCMS